MKYRRPPAARRGDVWRQRLHRASGIPGLPYELTPGQQGRAQGMQVIVNRHGMRDDEPLPDGTPGLVRIAALGDSFTFGFYVDAAQAWPEVLQRLLNEKAPEGVRYDVLNFGVGGYGTRDEALLLEHRVLAWRPDRVILGYVLNDPEIDAIQPLRTHFDGVRWWQHSHLLRLVREAWQRRALQRYGDGDYLRYLHAEPEKWGSVLAGFDRIAALCRAPGIPVLVVLFPMTPPVPAWAAYPYRDLHEQVAQAARERDFQVLDLLPVFARHPPQGLRNRKDEHLSPRGYELAARAIAQALREK